MLKGKFGSVKKGKCCTGMKSVNHLWTLRTKNQVVVISNSRKEYNEIICFERKHRETRLKQ